MKKGFLRREALFIFAPMRSHNQRISIKAWAEDDRPREKLLSKGKNALSDAELVALLIGSGSKDESAVELSKRILNSVDNNLNSLGKLGEKDLMQFPGIGEAKAISIIATMELARRRSAQARAKRRKVNTGSDIFEMFHSQMADLSHEEFWVVAVNMANDVVAKFLVSKGGVNRTVVDTRIVFKTALESLATGIILCHNHPSGRVKPSKADIEMTQNLIKAGKLMEIEVLDHIIVAESGYYSFADAGKIEELAEG